MTDEKPSHMDEHMILIVGEYMTGKTVSACTFPKPLLYLDFDGNFLSVIHAKGSDGKLIISQEEREQITVVSFRKKRVYSLNFRTALGGKQAPVHTAEAAQLMERFNTLLESLSRGDGVDGNKVQYKTIVFDSLTSMFRLWKEALLYANSQSSLTIPDYGTLETLLFSLFLPNVAALPIDHKVFLDHVEMEKDKLTGMVTEFPVGTSRAQGKQLGKEFAEVWRQEVVGGRYIWRTQKGTGLMQVGSRTHMADGLEANYKSIKEHIEKTRN